MSQKGGTFFTLPSRINGKNTHLVTTDPLELDETYISYNGMLQSNSFLSTRQTQIKTNLSYKINM